MLEVCSSVSGFVTRIRIYLIILQFAKVPCQDVLTKDSASLSVDGVVMFRVFDPIKSIQNVEKYKESIVALGSTTLRNILGISTLNEILFGDFDKR